MFISKMLRRFGQSKHGSSLFSPDVTLFIGSTATGGTNTFLDSSPNNLTVNKVGTPVQSTFTPFGDNWGTYFNGSSSIYATTGNMVNFGLESFTVECWVYLTSNANQMILEGYGNSGFQLFLEGGILHAGVSGVPSDGYTVPTSFYNTWNHIAVVRNGLGTDQTSLFVNGVLVKYLTIASNFTEVGFQIARTSGYTLYGYVSNLRTVKGSALYINEFTPPTTPLTAVPNTLLLACKSCYIEDKSANNHTLTTYGTLSISRYSPFTQQEYNPITIGGSIYFDGVDDYLTLPNSSELQFGTSDFTIECWYNSSTVNGVFPQIIGQFTSSASGQWRCSTIFNSVDNLGFTYGTSSFVDYYTGVKVNDGLWHHLVWCRSGNTLYIFKDGVLAGSTTITVSLGEASQATLVGYNSYNNSYTKGYISNLRVVKGTALYTTNFTPPEAPLIAVANTQILLSGTNGKVIDLAENNAIVPVGSAGIDLTTFKYGNQSYVFNGTTDYFVLPSTQDITLGEKDFTFECWFMTNNSSIDQTIVTINANTNESSFAGLVVQVWHGYLKFLLSTSGAAWYLSASAIATISANAWYHVAIVRNGTIITAYLNGQPVYSGSVSGALYQGTINYVGALAYSGTSYYFNGYMSDIKLTRRAVYTEAFLPPTA